MTVTTILTAPLHERKSPVRGAFAVSKDDELTLELASFEPHPVHRVPTYFFRMIHRDSKEELGRINLRVASTPHIERYAGHIGFAVHPASSGHRYAARATRLLLPLARELRLNPVWITTDPENIASRHSCEQAGAELIEIVDVPETCIIHRDGHKQKCRYRLLVNPDCTARWPRFGVGCL
jgi:predicted acetyltransferase